MGFCAKVISLQKTTFHTSSTDERAQQLKPSKSTTTKSLVISFLQLTCDKIAHKQSHRASSLLLWCPRTSVMPYCHPLRADVLQSGFTGHDLEQRVWPGTSVKFRDLFFLCSQESFSSLLCTHSMKTLQTKTGNDFAGERGV